MDRAKHLRGDQKPAPIILNDRQVYRVVVNKSAPPGQSHGLGHVAVSMLR